MEIFKIAILSDLHVSDKESEDSWITTSSPDNDKNPFYGLKNFINVNSLNADLLICCGDIADKANFSGQKYAWEELNKLAKELEVEKFIATPGNHDLDSRFSDSTFDAKGGLQKLKPMFPAEPEDYSNAFWAKNFAFSVFNEKIRVLNINSSAFHGYGKNNEEFLHGRISDFTLEKIEEELKNDKSDYEINIAFFHHHPFKNDSIHYEDYSDMVGGTKLIKLLSNVEFGSWIIIHGHKHISNMTYSEGSSSSPLIFSSGSFSSKRLEPESRDNQFYIMELNIKEANNLELDYAGIVNSWSWSYSLGWRDSEFSSNIPNKSGFGCREGYPKLIKKIDNIFQSVTSYLKWEELEEKIPSLKFLLPIDIKNLVTLLNKNKYNLSFNEFGKPSEIYKKVKDV